MSDDLKIRMPEWARNMYNRLLAKIDAGGGGGEVNVIESISLNGTNVPPDVNKNVALAESDPTVPAWAKASSKPSYTASEVGALPSSTVIPGKVSDLTNDAGYQTASDVASAISNADTATTSAAGLMSAADKTKLDGIAAGAQVNSVTGVKGGAESNYRTGNVNLTPANVGAVSTGLTTISDCDDNTLHGDGAQIHFYRTDSNTLHTPYKQGLTDAAEGMLLVLGTANYTTQIHYLAGNSRIYVRHKAGSGSTWDNKAWTVTVLGVKGNAENDYRTGLVNLTPANVGAAAADTHRINFYSNPSQLGLSGNSTVLQIFQALPDNSVIVTSDGLLASDMPNGSTMGQLMIWRGVDSRTFIQFFGKVASRGTWRMYLGATSYNGNNDNAPDGVWYPVVDGFSLVTIQSASKSVTVAAGATETVLFDLPNAANYKVLCINGYRSTNIDLVPITIGMSSTGIQNNRIVVRNISSSSQTASAYITWLAIRLQ